MSIPVQSLPSIMPPRRFEGRAELMQPGPVSPELSASQEAGFDGHVKVPAYFALWLELLELMQKQREADRALSSKVGLLTQNMSRAQAQHVRDEGTNMFAGALAGAAMGLAIGAAGAAISHRAFGKQVSGPATLERPASGSATRSVTDGDDMSLAARSYSDDLSELGEWDSAGSVSSCSYSSRSYSSRSASERGSDDIASPSSWLDRLEMKCFGRTYEVNPSGSSSRTSVEIPGGPDASESVQPIAFEPIGSASSSPVASCAGSSVGSIRSVRSVDSARSEEAGGAEVGARNDWTGGPAEDIAPHHPGTTDDLIRAQRKGLIGQMLVGNAASVGAVGASGGQMAAAMDRADAGLLQTSGMISESTKHNRGEEARNSNEAVTRALAALRDQNQDLRQTVSQIVSSIRA